jgi:FkbM family methyltransferase
LPFDQIATDREGRLVLSKTDVDIESYDRCFLLKGISLVDDLRRLSGAQFEIGERDRVIMTTHGVRISLTCWEELFIAHEVFHRKIYNISVERPFHVIDVGMNTGTSALFFASMAACERVVGYELFEPTLQRAMENISLNPDFGRKIEACAYGLGPTDADLTLDYFPEYKGSIGRGGLPQYSHPQKVKLKQQRENVQIRAVVPVFERLLAEARDREVVCKVDCEGAEYEIISCLARAQLLKDVSVFLIEWHLHGPQPIKKLLVEAGFDCLSLDEDSENHGMLYAFKSSS